MLIAARTRDSDSDSDSEDTKELERNQREFIHGFWFRGNS